MQARLYFMAISHPSHAARKMLDLKGVDYEVVAVMPLAQRLHLRLAGFRGGTVRNILEFPRHFDRCPVVTLSVNYRSHSAIVAGYNRFMAAWDWSNPAGGPAFREPRAEDAQCSCPCSQGLLGGRPGVVLVGDRRGLRGDRRSRTVRPGPRRRCALRARRRLRGGRRRRSALWPFLLGPPRTHGVSLWVRGVLKLPQAAERPRQVAAQHDDGERICQDQIDHGTGSAPASAPRAATTRAGSVTPWRSSSSVSIR